MLSRWVPLLRPKRQTNDARSRHSLVTTALVVMLLASLFPLLLIGTLNMLRSRSLLREQLNSQAGSLLSHEINQINQYVRTRNTVMDQLVTDENFRGALINMINSASGSNEFTQARNQVLYAFRGNPRTAAEGFYDKMFILRPDFSLALATDETWVTQQFGSVLIQNALLRDLIGTNKSFFAFNSLPDQKTGLLLYTTRSFVDETGSPVATLITAKIISSSELIFRTAAESGSFLPGARSYYITPQSMVGVSGEDLQTVEISRQMRSALLPLMGKQPMQTQFNTRIDGDQVYAFAHWLPDYNMGVVLTVSQDAIFHSTRLFDPFNVALFLISLLITGTAIYLGSTRLVRPLVDLSETVNQFSSGNWSARARISRRDEIGQLAHSFNNMAEELTELYHSLETAVESRTTTLRTASEVAQLATSTPTLSDTLGRTAELIAERFGFYHVAIYLYDETGQNLVLREASGVSGALIKKEGDRIEFTAKTLINWVAENQKARIISDPRTDELFRPNPLLPDTQAEVAIPILLGVEVLGVLDIQSTLEDAFTEETIAVFQTLANQISSTLQATRLLESTQVSYQETSLLYQAARKIAQARNEGDIIQNVADAFLQMPYLGAVLSVEGDNFKILALTDPKTGKIERSLQTLNIPTGRMAGLLEENRVVLIEDITQTNEYDNLVSFLLRRNYVSAALLSVLENGRLSKVLVISSDEANTITQPGLQPFANLAEVVGAALDKFRVLGTLQSRLSELQVLSSFSQAISAETDLNHLYKVLHEQINQTFGSDLEFAVAIYNETLNQVEFPYFFENGKIIEIEPTKPGEGLTSKVILSRQPLLLTNERSIREHSPIVSGLPPRSWMGVPLVFGGKVVGAILVQDLRSENRFDQDDLNMILALAPQIATTVRNTQLYTETQNALRAYDEERFLLNTLLDNMPEGISFKDTHGRYIRASQSIARGLEAAPEELIGKTDFDLMDREQAERIFHDEQMVMNLGKPEIGLIQNMPDASGKTRWIHISRIPVRTASGSPYGLLLIHREITDLKEAEALAQRRAEQVTTAAEIARDTTGTLDVKTVLQKSVNLVRERFGFYHASIFLLDTAGEYAVLRESTGTAGQQMMAAGHRLGVGSRSIVGQVTGHGKPIIVNDVTHDPTHLPNPLLPDTRSELAIPLKVGDRVLGALDVQSTQYHAFNPEDVGVLAILSDQLAVAVVNSELFAKTQELLGKHRLLRQISIGASSSTNLEEAVHNVVSGLRTAMVGDRIALYLLNDEGLLQVEASAGYEGTQHQETRTALGQGTAGQAALEKRPIRVDDVLSSPQNANAEPDVRSELAIPILFSDELLGVLSLQSAQVAAFDENDQEILGALGNNLGGVIANIRLVNQVRQQVIRERQLFDVASKIRHSVDLGTIIETSTKEIARALGARRASIRITVGSSSQSEAASVQPFNGSDKEANNGHKNGREE